MNGAPQVAQVMDAFSGILAEVVHLPEVEDVLVAVDPYMVEERFDQFKTTVELPVFLNFLGFIDDVSKADHDLSALRLEIGHQGKQLAPKSRRNMIDNEEIRPKTGDRSSESFSSSSQSFGDVHQRVARNVIPLSVLCDRIESDYGSSGRQRIETSSR